MQKNNLDHNPPSSDEKIKTVQVNVFPEERSHFGVAYLEKIIGIFENLDRTAFPLRERFYNICGQTVCLRFRGDTLIPLFTPALEHLQTPSTPHPSLTIHIWDGQSTETHLPDPAMLFQPWNNDDYIDRGEINGLNDSRIRTSYIIEPGILSILDFEKGVGAYYVRSASNIPVNYRGSPFLTIFSWWVHRRGLLFLHSGAIGKNDGGILLAGKGGSGKSTTALSSLQSNLFYLSDDYCVVSPENEPQAYSMYSSGKLEPHHIKTFPHLLSTVANKGSSDEEKCLIYLQRFFPEKLLLQMPLRAIFLPNVIGHGATRIIRARSAAALLALAPSTIFQLTGAGAMEFERMADFVKKLPCFHLELGSDIANIPVVIEEFLTKGAS